MDSHPDYSLACISRGRLPYTKVMTVASLPDTTPFHHGDADVDADDDETALDDAPPNAARGRTPCWAIERLPRSDVGEYVGAKLVGRPAESWDSRRMQVAVVAEEGVVQAVMYSNWNATWRNDLRCNTTLVVADSSYSDGDMGTVRCGWHNLARNAAVGYAVDSDTWGPTCRCTVRSTWCDNTWWCWARYRRAVHCNDSLRSLLEGYDVASLIECWCISCPRHRHRRLRYATCGCWRAAAAPGSNDDHSCAHRTDARYRHRTAF